MEEGTLMSGSLKDRIKSVVFFIEKNSLAISLVALLLGVFATAYSPSVGESVSNGVGALIGAYGYFVPFLIYFLITPALVKLIALAREYGNGWLISVLKQFAAARFLAILFAITALTLMFGLPFHLNHGTTLSMALGKALAQLANTLVYSPLLHGVYAAIITMLLSFKIKVIEHLAERVSNFVEYLGGGLAVLAPLFMFAVGSFFYHLPIYLKESLSQSLSAGADGVLNTLNFNLIGFNLIPEKYNFLALYVMIGLTTGLLCLVWHAFYIIYTKYVMRGFSLRYYVKNYWIKVYPLLWSSSSETLAVPLSLNLMKKNFPNIPSGIRQFVITGGSYLGINGTLISVYVMAVFLARVVSVDISFVQLLFSLPVVFILGYAVPGIPGELIIFAGAMGTLLSIPPALMPIFLALYITLQIGLPDSFRTGCNSTDSALLAISTSDKFERAKAEKYAKESMSH